MLTRKMIFDTLKELGLKNTDNIMIHSSLKSIGEIEGNGLGLIECLKEYFNEGLVMLPMHTWSFMNNDLDILDLSKENSCVGILPNLALRSGFIRSFHPTHSIVAYGKNASSYIKYDDNAKTPVPYDGCFGMLHTIDAKILFLGASLIKNTFIHSIEEKYNVPNRFTNHTYKFYSKKGDIIKEYNVKKHYSTLNPHLSEHYIKLEKPMIDLGIAKFFKFGNANSIIIDSKKCYELTCKLLEQDLHIFDDLKPIDEKLYN